MIEKSHKYYSKAIEFARKTCGPYADLEYLGIYKGYEVYQVFYKNESTQNLVGDFILANEEMIFRTNHRESPEIASQFNI